MLEIPEVGAQVDFWYLRRNLRRSLRRNLRRNLPTSVGYWLLGYKNKTLLYLLTKLNVTRSTERSIPIAGNCSGCLQWQVQEGQVQVAVPQLQEDSSICLQQGYCSLGCPVENRCGDVVMCGVVWCGVMCGVV